MVRKILFVIGNREAVLLLQPTLVVNWMLKILVQSKAMVQGFS
jgi:hypothetical protein